jgi:hypothetical protein
MVTTAEPTSPPSRPVGPPAPARSAWVGLVVGLLLVAASIGVPLLLAWDVHPRLHEDDGILPPLHGYRRPNVGPGTAPAILLALLALRYAAALAEPLPWGRLLAASYVVAVAWMLSLAHVDGREGISRVLGDRTEYLPIARLTGDVPAMLAEFTSRIPFDSAHHWPIHVAGHPPGALLFFVGLVRLGLGGDYAAGTVVTVLAATTVLAVLVTVRALGDEAAARRAAPFLVLTPAAVFSAVSADAFFGAVAAWGLAALALAATGARRHRAVAWAVLAGLLLGTSVLMSYGLPLIGLIALGVLAAARRWWPLPVAGASALVVVLTLVPFGFAWWDAYPVLAERYWRGLAKERPAAYWTWGNLGALLICGGPALGAGLARLAPVRGLLRDPGTRVVTLLSGAALGCVLLADASQMSKGEVERIWLPFVPWLTLALVLVPPSWRRPMLAVQLVSALLVQHLVQTTW